MSNHFLFEGDNSPLGKWDKLMAKLGKKSEAARHEAQRREGYRPDSWEGLCGAWSMAAIVTPEPKGPKTIKGITFTIADQKALLTYSHLQHDKKVYGISYRGNVATDGAYQDIRPEAFHHVVTEVLGKRKHAVVMDDDAGVPVWNKPLTYYSWVMTRSDNLTDVIELKTRQTVVNQRQKETNDPTVINDLLNSSYTFRFYLDRSTERDGMFKVVAGQWTKTSLTSHPDNVTVPFFGNTNIGSISDEFNNNIDMFRELFLD
jgi:hypothetical protein